jgi:hypothetical protein
MPHNLEELNRLRPIFSARIIENLKLLKDAQDSPSPERRKAILAEYESGKKISNELRKRIEELLELTK